jgi:molecular chaperone DnaK (HSP70)
MSVIEIVIVSSVSFLVLVFASLAVAARMQYNRALQMIAQLLIEKSAMSKEIDRLNFAVDNAPELQDGFTKFLSESREEAFGYIYDVQEAIDQLRLALDLADEAHISEAYNKLISFLPSENQDVVD